MKKSDIATQYNIGEHIKTERKSLGLRQADLAKATKLTPVICPISREGRLFQQYPLCTGSEKLSTGRWSIFFRK